MPAGDRTGPAGEGPQTGRGMGFCSGNAAPGYMNPLWGRGRMMRGRGGFGAGFGMGRAGFGRGLRRGWGYAPYATFQAPAKQESEAHVLQQEAQLLEQELKAIQARLRQIEALPHPEK